MSAERNALEPRDPPAEERENAFEWDAECVKQCEEFVDRYRKGEIIKSLALLGIREVLVDAPTVKSGGSEHLSIALAIYVDMLDEVDRSTDRAAWHGEQQSSQMLSETILGRVEQ